MKRAVALIVLFIMIIGSVGICESLDLGSMTEFELVELLIKVQDALYEYEPNLDFVFYPGTYVVGEDIEAGNYLVSVLEYRDENEPVVSFVTVWPDMDTCKNGSQSDAFQRERFDKKSDPTVQFNLKDGMVMEVHYSVYQFIRRK